VIRRFDLSARAATPWKNGAGATRELAVWPETASLSDFDWRISIAEIAQDGPFSTFPGIDRVIMLLDGDGVELTGPTFSHCLTTPHRPFAFAGESAVSARLLGGPSRDFNVMARRGRFDVEVDVLATAAQLKPSNGGLLFSVDGSWRANDTALEQGQILWWADGPLQWLLQPNDPTAKLIAVRLFEGHQPTITHAR
jgi:environmental stress-induced protein Ves